MAVFTSLTRATVRWNASTPAAGQMAWRAAPTGRQPAGEGAGQRRDHSLHLAQLLTGGSQEFHVLRKLWDAVHLDVVAAELLGGAPLGLGVDHFPQLRDPLRG